MTFISPETRINEQSVSNFVSSVAANSAGFVLESETGPCYEITTINSIQTYEETFGLPTDTNAKFWFTGYNFLQYANNLQAVRVIGKTSLNAGKAFQQKDASSTTPTSATMTRLNSSDSPTISFATDEKVKFFYKYPGTQGNNYKVAICNYEDYDTIELTHGTVTNGPFVVGETVTGGTSSATGVIVYLDATHVKVNNVFGTFSTETITSGTKTATVSAVGSYATAATGVTFDSLYDFSLESDQILVVVLDTNDQVLEVFACSLTVGTKDASGNVIYVNDYLERSSLYIYGYNNTAQAKIPATITATAIAGGTTVAPSNAEIQEGWGQFLNPDNSDAWVLMLGGYNENSTIQKYVIQSIADERKEIFVLVSPTQASVVGVATESATATNVIKHRVITLGVNSSYSFYIGSYKYQEDTYNTTNRWLPLDGDVAGLIVDTTQNVSVGRFAWGYENGLIKNIIKLAWNPSKTSRDDLWKKEINSVIKDGSSTLLFGNKTMLGISGVFDVADHRLLFNYIKRGLAQWMKFYISERNNTNTQRRLFSSINNLLSPLEGTGDIEEYRIETGPSVNTDVVKAANQLKGLVAVKPAASSRFIEIDLYALGSDIDINEVIS